MIPGESKGLVNGGGLGGRARMAEGEGEGELPESIRSSLHPLCLATDAFSAPRKEERQQPGVS